MVVAIKARNSKIILNTNIIKCVLPDSDGKGSIINCFEYNKSNQQEYQISVAEDY